MLITAPAPERLPPVASALARECDGEFASAGDRAWATLARGHHAAALVSRGLPTASAHETLWRLAGMEGRRTPVVAVGPADDVLLRVSRSHGFAGAVQGFPCSDAVLLRHPHALLDIEVERRLAALPPDQRGLVRSTHDLLAAAAVEPPAAPSSRPWAPAA